MIRAGDQKGRNALRDQFGEGDPDRAGHVVSPEPLGSKASVLMRRSRQLGCSTLIISTASIEHSSQIRTCGPATSCITSLCFLPQNEQAGVLIVAFEALLSRSDPGGRGRAWPIIPPIGPGGKSPKA